jgi:uncharacterized membrane protein YjjP (DUF1212 family)
VNRIASYATDEPPKAEVPKQLDAQELSEKLDAIRNSLPNSPNTSPVTERANTSSEVEQKNTISVPQKEMEHSSSSEQILPNKRASLKETDSASAQNTDLRRTILELASYGPGFFSPRKAAAKSPVDPLMNDPLHDIQRSAKINKKHARIFSKIAMEDGMMCLSQIMHAKPLYPKWFQWLLYGIAAASCCGLFFKGNFVDMLVSFIMGIYVALLGSLNKDAQFSRIYEFLCAFSVSLMARIVYQFITPICYRAVTIGAIIWLLKGVTITMSIIELMTQHIICGTVHLFYGILISALMGFGLDLGTAVFAHLIGISKEDAMNQTACSPERGIPSYFYPLFFLTCTLSFNLLMGAHYKQLLPMTVVATFCYVTSYFMGPVIGTNGTSILAAFVAGVSGNLYSRYSGNPATIYVMSGLLLLVPGSVAVTGFFMLLQKDASGGTSLAIGMLMISMALAIGIFLSSLFIKNDETKAWFNRLEDILRVRGMHAKRSNLVF